MTPNDLKPGKLVQCGFYAGIGFILALLPVCMLYLMAVALWVWQVQHRP